MAESVRINFVTGAARRHVAELEALAAVPDRVQAALAGQSAAWLRQPVPSGTVPEGAAGEWSPARVLGHLVAYARQSHENLVRMPS